jgi:hypothetical protein
MKNIKRLVKRSVKRPNRSLRSTADIGHGYDWL